MMVSMADQKLQWLRRVHFLCGKSGTEQDGGGPQHLGEGRGGKELLRH